MFDQLIETLSLHGNWIDLAFIILIVYFVLTQKGFIHSMLEAVSFIFSLFISYKSYFFFGKLLISNFSLPRGMANAAGFFIAWFLAEIIISVLLLGFIIKVFRKYQKHPLNVSFGIVAAILQACAIFLFFVSFIFAFPVRGQIKQAVIESRTGPYFVDASRSLEKQLKSIFGDAVTETLNFVTIKPQSNERVDLGVKPQKKQLSYDSQSEFTMFAKVNDERKKSGVKPLEFDNGLRDLARDYATEMFTNGFFSHVSAVDGTTPADRATIHGVSFMVIGENLAFAPDVYIAHEGLMNSEGHRKNILLEDFGKVGIGVVDGGIYGRMFVQEFTN